MACVVRLADLANHVAVFSRRIGDELVEENPDVCFHDLMCYV